MVKTQHPRIWLYVIATLSFAFIMLWGAIQTGKWEALFSAMAYLLFAAAVLYFLKRHKIILPAWLEVVIIAFIFAGIYLGEFADMYANVIWWDTFLHFFSGTVLAIIGYLIFKIENQRHNKNSAVSLSILFAFCFSMSLAALWELYEFFADNYFGTQMLKAGLIDTMWDMIMGGAGALLAVIYLSLYLKFSR